MAGSTERKFKALLVWSDPADQIYAELQKCLTPQFTLRTIEARDRIAADDWRPDIVFAVYSGPGSQEAWPTGKRIHEAPVIALAKSVNSREILDLLQRGVSDFVLRPLAPEDVLPRTLRLIDRARKDDPGERVAQQYALSRMIGGSSTLGHVLRNISSVARCDATVLISGETGAGKELCARSLHYMSPRSNKPFVPVNCGAIPLVLVENEFFGHERGAYTHAATSEHGLIYEADGGTLFLDEIDCLPPQAQVKLLRFLQEREYRAVGSRKTRSADVRVIAALNVEPEEAVQAEKLRRDLFYRLNVISFRLPPLRERREDIPELAKHFMEKYAGEYCSGVIELSPEALSSLISHDWPGNIRELENVIHRAIVLSESAIIGRADLNIPKSADSQPETFSASKAAVIRDFERKYILRLLRMYNGNITRAAQAARKHRRAFWQLIRKHHIDVHDLKSDIVTG